MTEIPADLRYSKDHLWACPDGCASPVRVGVTDFYESLEFSYRLIKVLAGP